MNGTIEHSQLMDETYRYQRLIYDLTRKYYLLGRDHLIDEMNIQPGARVLEVACGTGRNLAMIHKRYPEAKIYGFDISDQMLTTARTKLGRNAVLAKGDACRFDPRAMFGVESFDHIVLSYSLSMIPDWKGALTEATRHLAPGGQLHVVDFGDSAGLPRWFQRALLGWLARFHVAPRTTLETALRELAQNDGKVTLRRLYRNYAVYGCFTSESR
ncbi:class I SAM-dependent methyltransferase [Ruegeria arenilitoris]|uniref:class I SAM-dependent methyltransferase n=1 Tax=Ruegeria arenilitoris TaxID=1173585 RepID=UPI00147C8A5C|nr:class I SAM-dependent methyltransferase [Ruegeria arenilitoris]